MQMALRGALPLGKIKMGESGVGEFIKSSDDEKGIYVNFSNYSSRYVYIGPEKISENTGMILKLHKIVKIRKSKK